MASYANTSIRSFVGAQGGFGQGSYNAAKAAGLSDDQIKNQLSASGLQVGSWVSNQLGLKPTSIAPAATSQAATGTVSQAATPNVNSFRSGGAFNLNSYNAAVAAGLNDDQIRNQLLGSGLTVGTGVQTKLGIPGAPAPIQKLPPSQQPAAQAPANGPAPAAAAPAQGASSSPSAFAGQAFRGSVAADYVKQGTDSLVDLGNKYSDNPTLGGLVAGKLGDIASTQANTGLALAYNDAFLGSLGSYQRTLEDTKKANALELMSAEGAIARDMQKGNNATLRYNADASAGATKYTADKSLDQTKEQASASRYGADKTLEVAREQSSASRYGSDKTVEVAREQASASRYGADQDLAGIREQTGAQRYGADQTLAGIREQTGAQRYGYDQELAGVREQTASAERQIGLKGTEERRLLNEQTMQQLALRRDARGAIAQAGRRFYG